MADDKTIKDSINIDDYRKLIRSYLDLNLNSAALLWADKVATLTNYQPKDVYWLAQCLFLTKQYHRAAHVIRSKGLEKTDLRCHYLTVKCLIEAKELNEALEVLNGAEFDLNSFNAKHSDDSFMSNENCLKASLLFLRGKVNEALDKRFLAAENYKQALSYDIGCYDAFEALTQHQMLSANEERELLESLPYSQQCSPADEQLIRLVYECKLKKYEAPSDNLLSPPPPLSSLQANNDILAAQAERLYYNCYYNESYNLTCKILAADPYHPETLLVYISCLIELNRAPSLQLLSQKLVDHYPEAAISWYAVGCYYYLIKKRDFARKFLAKATSLDRLFGPAWLLYGHCFAEENEHDQAMAAYFKATQLMRGCHLPLLYVGIESGLTNNLKLAEKYLQEAKRIAPDDPFVMHELGVIAHQNKDFTAAEQLFEESLKRVHSIKDSILPYKWEPLLNNIGHNCRKLGKYDESIYFHQEALVLCPLNASTYASMGFALALSGRYHDAAEKFHKALSLKSEDTFSTTMLSKIMERLAEEEEPFQGAADVPGIGFTDIVMPSSSTRVGTSSGGPGSLATSTDKPSTQPTGSLQTVEDYLLSSTKSFEKQMNVMCSTLVGTDNNTTTTTTTSQDDNNIDMSLDASSVSGSEMAPRRVLRFSELDETSGLDID